jgi:hypothetical protein
MPTFEEELRVRQTGGRNVIRSHVVNRFLLEQPGTGNRELASKYRYFVEQLADGRRIFLERPAPLRWGFDFVIHIEGESFSEKRTNPSHSDILDDLKKKKRANPTRCKQLHEMIERVFRCEDPEDFIEDCRALTFSSGLDVETILKVVKWLFIEQDIRYWNYSGRNMLMHGLRGN